MNEMIELRDSKLVALSWADEVAIILLRPVRVHRSEGRPGLDAGMVWLQQAMFTVANASISAQGMLPANVRGGALTVGAEVRQNIIPAAGVFAANIKLELELDADNQFSVSCNQLMITLTGEAEYSEEFNPQVEAK